MSEMLRPLAGHAVLLLLLQLALLLLVARLGAELSRRCGLPAVIGELAAGLLLGPSVFGHFAPGAFAALFPPDAAQFHLLEVVGTLGMVLLLLLTGLETDIRLVRNLGRAALLASVAGMVVPFAMGFGLGMVTPERYLTAPEGRVLFSLFLATALSISAMPVIAKILMDLDLTRRNLGLVILSAGVVDDTTGWLILSLIAGAVSHGSIRLNELARTLTATALFLVAVAAILYPVLRVVVRLFSQRFRSPDSELVLIVVVTLGCAAATEAIGIHAVFGAFVAGVVLRQVPALQRDTIHRLEGFILAVLGPIFFGIVGLRVDLWALQGGGAMLAVVLAVACLGKLVGCMTGGLLSGMHFWEALSLSVAMNARGAMELVVAMIGLSLGILTQEMFSIIVVVALVTSFMAPLLLRLTMRRVRMTQEEAQRMLAERSKGVFDPDRLTILVPTAGGPNALGAARLAFGLAQRSANRVRLLFIDPQATFWDRVRRLFRADLAGKGLEGHMQALTALAGEKPPEVHRSAGRDVAGTICEEGRHGYDLIVMGASQRGPLLGGRILEEVVAGAPCHVAIIRTARPDVAFRRLLVPVDGSAVSRVAAELAVRHAEVTGASLTLAVLVDPRSRAPGYLGEDGRVVVGAPQPMLEEELDRISPVFRASPVRPEVLHLQPEGYRETVIRCAQQGYDLLVLGAENRAIQNRLFFGHDADRIIRESQISVAILVPHIARLTVGQGVYEVPATPPPEAVVAASAGAAG
jgi:Kef-type K+ transport system membrane component KefB/nucleotide-binding universal stress UspA family protein